MKQRRILKVAIILLTVFCIGIITKEVRASEITGYMGVNYREDGTGYRIGSGNTSGTNVWKIVRYPYYDTTGIEQPNYDKSIYCIRAGVGFTENGQSGNAVEYTVNKNMKTDADKEYILNIIRQILNDDSNYATYISNYNKILWILDNMYVPSSSKKDQDKATLFTSVTKYANTTNSIFNGALLNDNEIELVEQLAVWYYTNFDDEKYSNENFQTIFKGEKNSLADYVAIANIGADRDVAQARQDSMTTLFKYFITNADANSGYESTDVSPITINKDNAFCTQENAKYKFGPYEITKNSNLPYTFTYSFNKSGYVLKDEEGNTITDLQTVIKNLAVGSTLKVYAYIDATYGMEGNFEFTYEFDYTTTNATFIMAGVTANGDIILNSKGSSEQPLVNVEKIPHEDPGSVSIPIPKKEFDFSLRKFITAINGTPVDISRVPVYNAMNLNKTVNGKLVTTADYNHTKAPLTVKIGDTVTYTIRVYNEGELDGYVSKITDHLPEWLDFVKPEDLTNIENWTEYENENVEYGWLIDNTDTSNRTIYTEITAKSSSDTEELQSRLYASRGTKGTLLSKYAGDSTLDFIDVKINCIVNDNATDGILITNIADITGMTDEQGVSISADRDSIIANAPALSGDALQNYTGKDTYTVDQLGNSSNYYKGQEDDDDFEKVLVVIPKIDLKLVKNITEVNGQTILPDRLGSIDVSELNTVGSTKTTAVYPKNDTPILVKKGDIVTYRLTVFNEGYVDGYAKKITEDIPEGLEFLWTENENSTEEERAAIQFNNNYQWNNFVYDSNGKITQISTDYLSKEKSDQREESALLTAFGENDGTKTADNLSRQEIYVKMKVVSNNKLETVIRNEACISEDSDADGNDIIDRDSNPHRWIKYEDDEDYDNVVLMPFDLSLRKFITAVSKNTTIKPENKLTLPNGTYIREPIVETSKLNTIEDGEAITTAIYNHTKEPVEVKKGDYVVYTLRVYNEGYRDGYAAEIIDHLPEYLEFVSGTVDGIDYGWEVSEDGRTVTTDYLKNTKLDAAKFVGLDSNQYDLDYADVQIMCKVKNTAKYDEKITNIADITVYLDENKNTVLDRDSQINNVELPVDENLPTYKDNETGSYIPGQQDDDDFEKVIIKSFDLALRKFITKVNSTDINNRYPEVSYDDNIGKLVYTHTKEPVDVQSKDIVTYTIRVYNEGAVAGYAEEVKDDIPDGLEFLPNNSTNIYYEWKMYKVIDINGTKEYIEVTDPKEADVIITDYLSEEKETQGRQNIINPFNKNAEITETNPNYKDIKVAFKVTEPNTSDRIIINKAEIEQDSDDDIDSIPGKWNEGEDDQDIEKIKVKYFDLALRKFITKVNSTDINNRYPEVSYDDNIGKLVYTHTKEPLEVRNENIVTYTIRVYNEGQVAGYAEAVKDDIPDGLEFLPNNSTNTYYKWKMYKVIDINGTKEYIEVTDPKEADVIITDYLSEEKETSNRHNIINPFNKNIEVSNTNPYYRDVKVAFKVVEPNTSDRIIINYAEIQEDSNDDIDSTPGEWIDEEDDQDIEKIKVRYFDLALKKWVTQAIVTENGKTNVYETGHTGDENPEPVVKVEIQSKKINTVTVKFKYNIKVTNEGEIAGYAYELKDYIPEGLKFIAEDNPLWTDLGEGVISTTQLANTLLQPGETATVDVVLTWINGQNNMGLKVNIAEISKDSDDDIDSTPDNKQDGEDDIDDAPVMLAVKTGDFRVYFLLSGIVLVTLAGGIVLIKKFVL